MKKSFLLIMLMSLFSLTGWSAEISEANITVGDVPYGTAAAPLPFIVWSGEPLTKDTQYSIDDNVYSDAACTSVAAAADAMGALTPATYYLKIYGVGTGGFNGWTAAPFQVVKRELKFPLKATLEKLYGEADPALTDANIDWENAEDADHDFVGTDSKTVFTGTLSYSYDNGNVGTHNIYVTGYTADNYTLTVTGGIKIKVQTIAEAWFNKVLFSETYKGAAFAAADLGLTITDPRGTGAADDYVLTSDDYEVQINGGADAKLVQDEVYPVVVTGKGNYTGTVTLNTTKGLKIVKAPMSVAIANIPAPYKAAAYRIYTDDNGTPDNDADDFDVNEVQPIVTALIAAEKSPFTYYGFVGADVANQADVIATFTKPTPTVVADNKNVGLYALTWSGATSDNYDITLITTADKPGKLSIEPRKLTITASPNTKVVGTEDPQISFTITGYAPGEDKAAAITTDPVFQRAPGEDVGEYAISVKTEAVTKSNYTVPEANYIVSEVNPETGAIVGGPTFTITAGKPMLTILNQSKVYGAADPATIAAPVMGTNFIVTGLKAGDESKLAGIEFERTSGETVKSYTITLKSTVDLGTDYEPLTVVPGTFTITPASLAIVIKDQTVNKGADEAAILAQLDPSFVTVTGIADGDTQDEVFTLALNGVVPGTPGTYVDGIKFAPGAKAANYTYPDISTPAKLAPVAGNLIIVDPDATIVLNRPNKAAYEADPTLDNAATVIAAADATYTATEAAEANCGLGGALHYNDVKTPGTPAVAPTYTPAPVGPLEVGETYYTNDEGAGEFVADGTEANANGTNWYVMSDPGSPAVPDVLYTNAEVDAHNAALDGAFKAGDPKKKNVTFGDFAMIAEKWYPIVLPFATSVKEVSDEFGYAIVNILKDDNTDATKIRFKLHMGKIEANTPFVVKIYENKNMNTVTFDNKAIVNSAAPEVADASGVKFIGSYSAKTNGFKANEAFFSVSASKNDYYWGPSSTYMAPLGAYFQIPEGSPARTFEFEEADGTVTAISAVAFKNGVTNAEGWYTIGGMKLQGAPTQKGVYIQNGKKVIVK